MTGPSRSSVLAIDIGGTKIAFAEVEGDQIRNRRQIPTPRTGQGEDLVGAIGVEVDRCKPGGIAVATTGIVSRGALTALNPRTLSVEDGFPLADRLQAVTGLEPLVLNDAQAAAWGEYRFGAGRGRRNFMFVTVSTGVGGGLVLEGGLQVGLTGLAGHIGHMTVAGAAWPCGCGRAGCLEAVASGTAIARHYSETTGRDATAPEVFEAAASGHASAELILDRAAKALADTIANVIAAVDLEAVAIGGGVGLAPGFLERVRRHLSQVPQPFRRPIVPAAAGADAGLLGIADLAVRYDGNFHIETEIDRNLHMP